MFFKTNASLDHIRNTVISSCFYPRHAITSHSEVYINGTSLHFPKIFVEAAFQKSIIAEEYIFIKKIFIRHTISILS